MNCYSTETRKKITTVHIQDGRTIAILLTEYGVSTALSNNWVRDYHKKCKSTPEAKAEFELLEENCKLKQKLVEAEKENVFQKKQEHSSRRKQASNL